MATKSDFDFNQSVVLEDEHVLLRPLANTDFDQLSHFPESEPEIWKYSLVRITGPEDLQGYIKTAIDAKQAGREYPFIVFDKKQQKYAGSTRFYDIQLANQSIQLGYTWYGSQFQGTGLNKHCKFLLLDYAFGTMGMERVEFRADNRNARSIAAMKGIGCSVEGILRSTMPTMDGGRRDSIVLSIIREEWESMLRNKLKEKL